MRTWHEDLFLPTQRGTALKRLVQVMVTPPFNRDVFYEIADEALRKRHVIYADLAGILNSPEHVVRMRVRDRRRPRAVAA